MNRDDCECGVIRAGYAFLTRFVPEPDWGIHQRATRRSENKR